jgi:hypothetical protein
MRIPEPPRGTCVPIDPSKGEWRCRCPSDPSFDTSANPSFVKRCDRCGAERPPEPPNLSDEEVRTRSREVLSGIRRGVDMTHPDYCATCDGACYCGAVQRPGEGES